MVGINRGVGNDWFIGGDSCPGNDDMAFLTHIDHYVVFSVPMGKNVEELETYTYIYIIYYIYIYIYIYILFK